MILSNTSLAYVYFDVDINNMPCRDFRGQHVTDDYPLLMRQAVGTRYSRIDCDINLKT